MFQIQWLRRLIRQNTKKIPVNKAELWKHRLSIGYMLLAWNAFGFVLYNVFSGNKDWADTHGLKTEADKLLSPGQQWARSLDMPKAKIIRIKGLGTEEVENIAKVEKVDDLLEEGKYEEK